jgi:hypothetical protein
MNNKKERKGPKSVIRIVLTVISIFLIVWSFWPPANTRQTLTVNPELIESDGLPDCAPLSRLLDYEFELVTPRALWKTQSSTILMTMSRVSANADEADEMLIGSNEVCSLALETRLSVTNVHSEPGDTIIQPFVGADTQSFVFTISPLASGIVSGKLWVYADIRDIATGEGQSLPLFTIPLNLPVWTILGQPPVLVRYVSLLVLLILLAFYLRRRLQTEY